MKPDLPLPDTLDVLDVAQEAPGAVLVEIGRQHRRDHRLRLGDERLRAAFLYRARRVDHQPLDLLRRIAHIARFGPVEPGDRGGIRRPLPQPAQRGFLRIGIGQRGLLPPFRQGGRDGDRGHGFSAAALAIGDKNGFHLPEILIPSSRQVFKAPPPARVNKRPGRKLRRPCNRLAGRPPHQGAIRP